MGKSVPMANLEALRVGAGKAVAFGRKVKDLDRHGVVLPGMLEEAFNLAAEAGRLLEQMAGMVAPRTDPMPRDGTWIWVTSEADGGDIQLVRYGKVEGREGWGIVMHRVEDGVWLNESHYCLWWPLDFFPLPDGKQAPEKSE